MAELFIIAWTSIIANCFVAIVFVPATRYQQYTTCACLLVTFGVCQRKGSVVTTACIEEGIPRRQRRCKQIRFLKRTFEYKEYLMYRRRRTLSIRGISENMPTTPDPFDESISRRTWEKKRADWRKAFCSYVYKT